MPSSEHFIVRSFEQDPSSGLRVVGTQFATEATAVESARLNAERHGGAIAFRVMVDAGGNDSFVVLGTFGSVPDPVVFATTPMQPLGTPPDEPGDTSRDPAGEPCRSRRPGPTGVVAL